MVFTSNPAKILGRIFRNSSHEHYISTMGTRVFEKKDEKCVLYVNYELELFDMEMAYFCQWNFCFQALIYNDYTPSSEDLFCIAWFRKVDVRTNNTCESSDHYRPRVGLPRGSICHRIKKTKCFYSPWQRGTTEVPGESRVFNSTLNPEVAILIVRISLSLHRFVILNGLQISPKHRNRKGYEYLSIGRRRGFAN